MFVLSLDIYEVLIDKGTKTEDLAHIDILLQNLLPELPCKVTSLLYHLLELDIDFLKFNH